MLEKVLLLYVSLIGIVKGNVLKCPCSNVSLCEPISIKYDREVLGFAVNSKDNYRFYDWSKLTTIAVFGEWSDELLCIAHEKNVRVVLETIIPRDHLTNDTYKNSWINDQITRVKLHHADGINIDIEYEMENGSKEYFALNQWIQDIQQAFGESLKHSQISFDVAWAPNCIDGRCYDYMNIAKFVDFLVVMSYDEQSQMLDDVCHAKPNSPILKTALGIGAYRKLGIPSSKLVIGLPWYGYNYPCLSLSDDNVCVIKEVPFRGVNCSDAAGREVCYESIIRDLMPFKTAPVQYDIKSISPYFNYKKNESIHQVWYDDPLTLSEKYNYIIDEVLKGIAIWNIDCALTNNIHGRQMWNALPNNDAPYNTNKS